MKNHFRLDKSPKKEYNKDDTKKGDFCSMGCIFDTHAHYFDKKFESLEGGADAVLCDLFENQGIGAIVNVGTNLQNAHSVIEQASRYAKMYAAVGIHPEDCHFITDPEAADRKSTRLNSSNT